MIVWKAILNIFKLINNKHKVIIEKMVGSNNSYNFFCFLYTIIIAIDNSLNIVK